MAAIAEPGPVERSAPAPRRHTRTWHEEHEPETVGSGAVYVWEVPVRITHWLIVISIVMLTITGLYIHGPFLTPPGPGAAESQMATMRFIHELFAIVFTISIAVRFYWGFVGNAFASWRQIIPHRREQLYWMREMFRYYTFRRRHPVPMTGHNHLAGLAYTIISIGMFGQVLTGLLLFGWLIGFGPVQALFGWGGLMPGGIQTVRLLHYLLTFSFLAFVIHHVYSAILVDIEERNGVLSSIFTGFKNIRPETTVEELGLAGDRPEDRGPRAGTDPDA